MASYILDAGSTFGAVTLLDSGTFEIVEQGTSTQIISDGTRYVNNIVTDRHMAMITVIGNNPGQLSAAGLRAGKAGALVLKGKLRGAGNTVSTAVTITFAEAVLVSNTSGLPGEGVSQAVLRFEAYDSNGDGSVVAYT